MIMKTMNRILRVTSLFVAVFALPYMASAAKTFVVPMTLGYTTTNISYGVAAAITNEIILYDGSGGSSVGSFSNCFYSVNITPSDPSIAISLTVTNFTSQKGPTGGSIQQSPISYVGITTTSLTPSNTYIVTVWANNSPSNSLAITPISASFSITMLPFVFVPQMAWTGAGTDMNWSTAGNWAASGPPTLSNDVVFVDEDSSSTVGTVNNTISSSIIVGSLDYGETNGYHTTSIGPGLTLTIVDTNGLYSGTIGDTGTQLTTNTITGGGTLIVSNTAATIEATQTDPGGNNGGNSAAISALDLSGLGMFQANIAQLLVGVDNIKKGANGQLNLARTNIITMTPGTPAAQIDVGDDTQANGVTGSALSALVLGQTNAFYVDSIAVGSGRVVTGGTMFFNSAFSSPSAFFRGTNGPTSRVGSWYIGNGESAKSATCHGTNDFSLGTVNALINTMYIANGSSGSTVVKGTLIMNAGIIDTYTLIMATVNEVTNVSTATIDLTGGSLVVETNLVMADGIGIGNINISGSGTLSANNGIASGGGTNSINMNGGTLSVTNLAALITTTNSPLANFSVTNATLDLAVVPNAAPNIQANAPSIATINLAIGSGTTTINISSVPYIASLPAQYPIIDYGFSGGSMSGSFANLALGSMPSGSPSYGAYLSNNLANNSIDIVITNGPTVVPLTWDGANNGNWNISTPNWKPASGPDTTYADPDFVTFNDTLSGTTNVILNGTLMPGNLTVNNTLSNYVFGGTGNIGGAVGLVKNGTGSLVVDNSGNNTFSGGVLVNGGTLQFGNNDANGNLPAGGVALNTGGTLAFDSSTADLAVPNVISGAGGLAQVGADILTLNASNNAYIGPITVLQGTIQAGNADAFGTNSSLGSITVTNSGTLDVNAQKFGVNALPVTVSGSGVGGNGAIINSSSNQTSVLNAVTLAADATFGGTGSWDIRTLGGQNTNQNAQLNGAFNLTKVGTNTITLNGVAVDSNLNNVNVQAGTLDLANMTSSLGNSSATATIYTNAVLELDTLSNVLVKNIVINSGGTLQGSATNFSGGPVTLNGPVTLAGNATIQVNGTNSLFMLENVIGGSASLTKSGSGTAFLANANTYSGNTIVSGGILSLTNYNSINGSINSSTNINITSGAKLDVTGRSDQMLTLTSGQTLEGGSGTNGPGILTGSLVANAGSYVSPGTGSTNIGTLSVNASVTLNGTTVMKISAAGGNDLLEANGITYGGSLMVTNFSGTITNTETFKIFIATNGNYSAGSFTGGVSLPSAPGLSWTNNLTVNGTITAGVIGVSPIPPNITGYSFLSPTQLVISGTSSSTNASFTYSVLTSTNVALSLPGWTLVSTGSAFSPTGQFSITNAVNPGTAPVSFYILRVP